MLYHIYLNYFKQKKFSTGFSWRLPDYATKYWFLNLQKAIQNNPNNNFLDIGAGQGRLSLLLAKNYFKKGFAIEVQPNQEQWKKISNECPQLQLIEGLLQNNIEKLKTNSKIDFVLLAEVFEHIPPNNVKTFLKSLHEILSPKGRIFLTTPNRTVQGSAKKSPQWYKKQPFGHYKHYKYKELKKLLGKNGFNVEWHTFECNKIKKILYNKIFYPAARLDQKFLASKKLPETIRQIYSFVSIPFIFVARGFFWLLAQFIYKIEQNYNNENNAETMIFSIQKK